MGKRVVVVVFQRRQRQQRGAVLRHRLGQAVDHRPRHVDVGLAFRLGAVPHRSRGGGGIAVQLLDRRHVGGGAFDALLDVHSADANVRQRRERQRFRRLRRRHGIDERLELVERHPAIDGDPFDAGLLQPLDQRPQILDTSNRRVVHDDFVADDAEDGGRFEAVQQLDRRRQGFEVAADDRVAFRIELGRAQRCAEAAEQLVGQLKARRGHAAPACVGRARSPITRAIRACRRGSVTRASKSISKRRRAR